MQALLRFFIERHLLVNVIAGSLVVLGWLSAANLQREFIPSVSTPIFWLTAMLPGASAQDVEAKLTIPIEEALAEVEGIDEYTTVVSDNTSYTTIELYDDYTQEQVESTELEIRAAVDAITDFPDDLEDEPVLRQLNPARETVIEVAMSGAMPELGQAAEALERRLERLEGISSVHVVGLADPEVRILVDPVRAEAHDLTLGEIIAAVRGRNVSSTGGVLEDPTGRRQVVMWSRFDDPLEVADVVLRHTMDGGLVRIRDIARIESGREDTGLVTHTDGQRGLTLLAQKRETADIIDSARAVRAATAAHTLPPGVRAEVTNDQSEIVSNRLRLIFNNGLIGIALVSVVLFAFVRPAPAIWILIGIPIVFLGALTLIGPLGMTLNLMCLTGLIIVLGMVVDDAVVVSERIVSKRALGLAPAEAALAGAREMLAPVTAAALTTMLAFLPLAFLGGLPGRIIWQIPAIVVLALIFSLIESFFVLPGHLSTIRGSVRLESRRFVRLLEAGYRKCLERLLRHRLAVVLTALASLTLVLVVVRPLIPFVLFPQDDASRLFIKVTAPIGTPLERTEAITTDLERQLLAILGSDLEVLTGRIGHQDTQAQTKGYGDAEHEALIQVQFKRFGRTWTNQEWIDRLPGRLRAPPDVRLIYQSEYFGPPTDQPVTVHVLSNDDKVRRGVAHAIEHWLSNIPGVIEVETDERPGAPQLDLNLDYEKLARLGLDAETVGNTLAAAFFGIKASEHRALDETTELRVQFDPGARMDLDALLDARIRTRNGTSARLRDLVEPIQTPAVSRIYHRDGFRSATIRAAFTTESGLAAMSFGARMEQELFPRFAGMEGLQVYNGGEAVETRKTTTSIGVAGLMAVLGITLVIWLMLGSLLEAVLAVAMIPFAVAGVLLVFFLHGKPVSLFTMMGAVGLAGVVVNAVIVMADAIHRKRAERNPQTPEARREALIEAVTERLRPILVTTLTTLGGVLPTAYGIGGYDPIVSIISLALGWGLAMSTLTTLFVAPVLFSLSADWRSRTSAPGGAMRQAPG